MSLANQPAQRDDYEQFFVELESRLSTISHSDEAVNVIESAVSERFKKTAQRQIAFAQPGSICLEPISRRDLYLPPLPGENSPTLGYSVRFDGIAQIRLDDLLLARRLCSLSLVGWRIFGSFARVLISWAGAGEARLRTGRSDGQRNQTS